MTPTRRIVRVAQQPATIDPSLEQAVATTAVNLYNFDIQLVSLRAQKARKDAAYGRFLRLPQQLPHVNPYAWPPSPLSLLGLTDYARQSAEAKQVGQLCPHNLRSAILAAGRREIPGYDAEKKRLVQVICGFHDCFE
ncbi:unnamed protein product [Dibothriocephalus latus]|uniref:Uncharacterized protein n=1 Tax=Dibothriocephalus latus TaxID=60516 RepID=A0A3P7NCM9_DIBLA|nr:unnamed protein product [Dibothriocephalus latus]